MMRLRAASLLAISFAFGVAGCPNSTNNMGDSATGNDGTNPNGDAPNADGNPADAATGVVCNTVSVENLNLLSPATGTPPMIDYTGTNSAAPITPAVGLQTTAPFWTSPTNPNVAGLCNFRIVHQRVFAYTVTADSILKISTNNAHTDPFFDTVVYVVDGTNTTGACAAHPGGTALQNIYLGCNDDDLNYSGDQRRITSTMVTTKQVHAGQTVLIGLGGFAPSGTGPTGDDTRAQGTFELTVQELPPVAANGACDVRRLNNPCADGSTCISNAWPSDVGTCKINGSAPGSACTTAHACSGTGLTCLTAAAPVGNRGFFPSTPPGVCLASATDGMPCNPSIQCDSTSTCVNQVRGSSVGTCRTNGTALGSACDGAGTCTGAGLVCSGGATPVCMLVAPAGGACSVFDSTCPQDMTTPANNQNCVASTATGGNGVCTQTATTAGTQCTAACTGAGLTCDPTQQICSVSAAPDAACDNTHICATGATCLLTDLTNVFDGVCTADNTAGGSCATSSTCPTGSMCDPNSSRCLAPVAINGACGLHDLCATGSTCVQESAVGAAFAGHCKADGSAAGVACHKMGTPCDSGLSCSSTIPEEGVCQTQLTTAGGACDPRLATVRCMGSQVCQSTSLATAGTCVTPSMETEPNDAPAATLANASAASTFQGSLSAFDIDCYGVTLAPNQSLYAAATSVSGVCGALPLELDVYSVDTMGTHLLGIDTISGTGRCPRIEGADPSHNFSWAVNSAATAVNWYVCVRNSNADGNPISSYVLNVAPVANVPH